MASVRGMGVAVMISWCGSFPWPFCRSCRRCCTPKRCCSSMIASAREANFMLSWNSACVPTIIRACPAAMAASAARQARMIVGTHALFQESMKFASLALAIIDEQHRFGVQQRLQLRQKGQGKLPHQLIMTATPIPRTLAMTAYADLDISVIDELPPGRK